MARFLSIVVLGVAFCSGLPAAPAWCQEPQPAALPQGDELLNALLGPGISKLDPAELAGMAPGAKPAVLTLEQAYSLTIIRGRDPAAATALISAGNFDSKAVDEIARRSGLSDFDRFRKEFLASEFNDPAPRFLAVLRHRYAVDCSREKVAFTESMGKLYDKMFQDKLSGLSQLHVDLVGEFLQTSRQGLAIDVATYRTAVDDLKVSLGLPPGTSVVIDDGVLAPFATSFIAIHRWQRNPSRQLEELPALHDRLPRLEELKIGGHSVAEVVQGTLFEEQFLRSCIDVARNHRPILKDANAALDDRNALELRIRRSARGLILIHKNYEHERRLLEFALREADQYSEQIVAPPVRIDSPLAQSTNLVTQTTRMNTSQRRLYDRRNQLVSSWLQFKERSLALHRELGTLPYDNWETFHRSFLPKAGSPAAQAVGAARESERPRPGAPRSQ
jgi:hypothetical protein